MVRVPAMPECKRPLTSRAHSCLEISGILRCWRFYFKIVGDTYLHSRHHPSPQVVALSRPAGTKTDLSRPPKNSNPSI